MQEQQAIEQIRIIRETMQRASRQFFTSPWQFIEWGILIFLGCLATLIMQANNATEHLAMLWIGIFIIGGALESISWLQEASKKGVDPLTPYFMKIWWVFLSLIAFGVIFTLVFYQLGQPLYIVGLWHCLMGVAVYNLVLLGDHREFIWFGTLQWVAGLLALTVLYEHAVWVAMFGFGISCTLMGIYFLIKEKRRPEKELVKEETIR